MDSTPFLVLEHYPDCDCVWFRVMSIEEKRQLGHSLGRLPADNLQRVIQIIAQKNPGFNASADEVEVDIDAQVPPYSPRARARLYRLYVGDK